MSRECRSEDSGSGTLLLILVLVLAVLYFLRNGVHHEGTDGINTEAEASSPIDNEGQD